MGSPGGVLSDPVFLAGVLSRHKTRLYASWYKSLQEKWGEETASKLRLLKKDRRAGKDLLTLIMAGLSGAGDDLGSRIAPILARVRLPAPHYSISDFFVEASCLKTAVQETLPHSPEVTCDELLETVTLVREKVDELVALVLRETSETYEYILEGGARGFCQLDPAGVIVYANKEMERLAGDRSLIGVELASLFAGEEQEFVRQAAAGRLATGLGVRLLTLRDRKNRKKPVGAEIGALMIANQYRGGFACFMALSHTVRAQQTILDKHPWGVIKVGLDEKINFANRKFLELLGWTTCQDKTVRDLAPSEEIYQLLKDKLARRRRGLSDTYETVFRHWEGRPVPVEISSLPDLDPRGNIVGSLAFIKNRKLEKAIAAIHRAVEGATDGPTLFQAVAQEVARIIPYDLFSLSVFSKDRHHLCRLFAYTNQGEPPRWDARWWAPPAKLLQWLRGHRKIHRIDNLEVFLSQEKWQKLLTLPEIQAYLQAGYRSLIRYPVVKENRVVAAITLSKKATGFYHRRHQKSLTALPLDKAVFRTLALERAKEERFRGKLIRKLTTGCNNFKAVVNNLVDSLADFYGWDNVALFKVEKEEELLRLLYQKASRQDFRLPDDYTQPLKPGPEGGVLSYVYLNRTAVNIGNVREDPKFRGHFLGLLTGTASELCVPVFTSEGDWLINIEDEQKDAFSLEHLEELQALCREVSAFLERSWLHHSLKSAFESTSDAIIRTDQRGRIRWLNQAGRKLLGYSEAELRGRLFQSLFKDQQVGEEVVQSQDYRSREVILTNKRGEPVEVLLSGFDLPAEFSRKVFMAKDLSLARRVKELEFLDVVYHELAGQIRTPLSLVFSWLALLSDELPQGAPQETLASIRRQLHKVELSCDRLALYDYDAAGGVAPYHEILLAFSEIVRCLQEEFPASEMKRINFRLPKDLPFIHGDLFQLTFCLKSILSFLLRFLPETEKIEVSAAPAGRWLTVTTTGLVAEEPEESPAARLLLDVALGEKIIHRFIQNHHGIYHEPKKAGGWLVFRFDLPLPQGEGQ